MVSTHSVLQSAKDAAERSSGRARAPARRRAAADRGDGDVRMISRAELAAWPAWRGAFAGHRKDARFYELLEDTLADGFDYRWLAVRDGGGAVAAVQPAFVVDQDLVEGAGQGARAFAAAVRRAWPGFLRLRTLMVGCVAGEGHLSGDADSHASLARALAGGIVGVAQTLRAPLIVLKEFPKAYRAPLQAFEARGFSRIPSLPMTRLPIAYASFDDYMARALNSATRRKLRKKFRIAAAAADPIEMSVVADAAPFVDEIYPLYLATYERSALRFEKLTKGFFAEIGRRMPGKARFFLWRQGGRIVAFSLCMPEGDALFAEYVGFDYAVALTLHLYHWCVRDMIGWAMAHGFTEFRSSALNYDPKLHMRHRLDPVDLYVRHLWGPANWLLKAALPWIEPTRQDPILRKFANYAELWD